MYSGKLEDRQAVARQVREAAHNIGFFYVVNHVGTLLYILLEEDRLFGIC